MVVTIAAVRYERVMIGICLYHSSTACAISFLSKYFLQNSQTRAPIRFKQISEISERNRFPKIRAQIAERETRRRRRRRTTAMADESERACALTTHKPWMTSPDESEHAWFSRTNHMKAHLTDMNCPVHPVCFSSFRPI